VFAREIGTTAPHESVKVVSVNTAVKLHTHYQDMTISPRDILMGDLNGVVVCPAHLVKEALPLIQPQVEADEKMAEAIKGGMSFTEAGKKYRAALGNGGKTQG
jgi:regulator of RNase E activity RraA